MGQSADPDINGVHADTELKATGGFLGYRYTTGRGDGETCSPHVGMKDAAVAIRAAAGEGPSQWASHLSTYHPAVWSWLQADAAAVAAYQTGRGIPTTATQILEHRRFMDALEAP